MKRIGLVVLGMWLGLASSVWGSTVFMDEEEFLAAVPDAMMESFEHLPVMDRNFVGHVLELPDFTITHSNPGEGEATLAVFRRTDWGRHPTDGLRFVTWIPGFGDKLIDIEFEFPISAFGFNITDALELGGTIVLSTDAGDVEVVLSGTYPEGDDQFFGIVSDVFFTKVTIKSDQPYDGVGLDEFYYSDVAPEEPVVVLDAAADLHPKTLNRKSKGRWATAYISLPEGFDARDIDLESVAIVGFENEAGLTGYVQFADLDFTPVVRDHDDDGVEDLTVKFDRGLLAGNLPPGEVAVWIGGFLTGGESFLGVSVIRVK